jgi:hypothetical protein
VIGNPSAPTSLLRAGAYGNPKGQKLATPPGSPGKRKKKKVEKAGDSEAMHSFVPTINPTNLGEGRRPVQRTWAGL